MNLGSHRVLESVVDETLSLDRSLALEPDRYNDGPEMAAALACTRMAYMQMALVDHFDVNSCESIAQLRFDSRAPIDRVRHVVMSSCDRCDQEVVIGTVRTCDCSSSGFGITRSRTPFL